MERAVKLYDLAPSPNSIKVRCALAWKRIPYERIPVDPRDRRPLVEVSGQPLSPVLLHGDAVVYDSYAITRYLDANWPDAPRLYSAERDAIKKIEEWELFGRTEPGPAISMMFGQLREPEKDPDKLKRANEVLNRAASRTEEALAKGRCLVGDALTAADFAVGTMLYYGTVWDQPSPAGPVLAFFGQHLKIQSAPRTVAWIGRIMEWDR
jgi:glutathione S-transferase